MTDRKTYRAHGQGHTGSTGFTNYRPGTRQDVARALDDVFADHPDAVVVDGDDDWYACGADRPASWPEMFGVEALAFFHSGISGISKSGVVLSREDFDRIEREFPTRTFKQIRKPDVTGVVLRERPALRIYTRGE